MPDESSIQRKCFNRTKRNNSGVSQCTPRPASRTGLTVPAYTPVSHDPLHVMASKIYNISHIFCRIVHLPDKSACQYFPTSLPSFAPKVNTTQTLRLRNTTCCPPRHRPNPISSQISPAHNDVTFPPNPLLRHSPHGSRCRPDGRTSSNLRPFPASYSQYRAVPIHARWDEGLRRWCAVVVCWE